MLQASITSGMIFCNDANRYFRVSSTVLTYAELFAVNARIAIMKADLFHDLTNADLKIPLHFIEEEKVRLIKSSRMEVFTRSKLFAMQHASAPRDILCTPNATILCQYFSIKD